jgi:hypothetical protein
MATVQELERAFLNAHNAGDKQAAQALADALRSAMSAQPAEAPAAPPKERTMLEAGKDILAGGVSGVGALAQLPGQLYGLATGDFSDTGLTKVGRKVREYAEEMKSPGLKQAEAERAAKIKEAGAEGEVRAGVTAFMETVKDPGLLTNFIAEQIPNLIPALGVARGLKVAGMGAQAVRGAVGTGAVQQGAEVGAQAYEELYKELKSKGMSDEEAAGRALGYARATGALGSVISLLAQRLPGAKAIEEALAGAEGKVVAGAIGKTGKYSGSTYAATRAGRAAVGALGEGASEIAEETGGKLLQNIALAQERPGYDITTGLGETAGMAAVGGVGLGTAAGLTKKVSEAAPPEAPPPAVRRGSDIIRERIESLEKQPQTPETQSVLSELRTQLDAVLGEETKIDSFKQEFSSLSEQERRNTLQTLQQEQLQREQLLSTPESIQQYAESQNIPVEEAQQQLQNLYQEGLLRKRAYSEFMETLEPPTVEFVSDIQQLTPEQKNSMLQQAIEPIRTAVSEGNIKLDDAIRIVNKSVNDEVLQATGFELLQNRDAELVENMLEVLRRESPTKETIADLLNDVDFMDDLQRIAEQSLAEQKELVQDILNLEEGQVQAAEKYGVDAENEAQMADMIATLQMQVDELRNLSQNESVYERLRDEIAEARTAEQKKDKEKEKEQEDFTNVPDDLLEKLDAHAFGQKLGAEYVRLGTNIDFFRQSNKNPDMFRAVSVGDRNGVADELAKSKNPAIRLVSEKMRSLGTTVRMGFPRHMQHKKWAGYFDPQINAVFLRKKYSQSEEVIAHEFVHALTAYAIARPTPEQRPTIDKLNKLYQHVKKELGGNRNIYGLTNLDEFISEANSNVNFQYQLAKIKYKNETAWGAFTKMISKLLGIANVSALTEVIALTEELTSKQATNFPMGMPGKVLPAKPPQAPQRTQVGTNVMNTLSQMNREVKPPPPGYKDRIESIYKDVKQNPQLTAQSAKAATKKFLDKMETVVFSSDAALNNAIRRNIMATTAGMDVKIGQLLEVSLSQTVHADALASLHMMEGSIHYDKELHKWIAGKRVYNNKLQKFEVITPDANLKTLAQQVDKLAEKYGLTKEEAMLVAHTAFEAKRLRSLERDNAAIKAQVAVIRREARKLTSEAKAAEAAGNTDEAENKFAKAEKKRAEARKLLAKKKIVHMTPTEIGAGMDFFKTMPELNGLVDTWQGMRNNTADVLVESGLWSRDEADFLLDNIDYVPFYREEQIEQGKGPKEFIRGLQVQARDPKFKGSQRRVNDIFDNMARWMQYAVNRSVRNRSALSLIDSAVNNGLGKKVSKPVRGGNNVNVWRDGKQEFYEMDDPLYVDAFRGLESVAIPALNFFSKMSNLLRQSVVMYPFFSVAQVPQDSFAAMFSSGLKPQFALRIPALAVKEFLKTIFKKSQTHEVLRKAGAVGVKDFSAAVARLDAEMLAGLKAPAGVKGKVKNWLTHFAMSADNAVRQAVYEASKQAGLSQAEALEKAFQVINFRTRGTSKGLALAGQVVPFFNAYIAAQHVAYKTITGVGTSPQERNAALKTLAATMGSVMTLSLIYAMMNADDDDYKNKPAPVRDRLLMIPGTGMSIPLRMDLFTFPKVLTEHLYLLITDKGYEDSRKFRDSMFNALKNAVFSPTPVPQAIKPLFEVGINYDLFQGRPLIGTFQKGLETERQFNNSTSELGKLFGSTGLVSPIAVDHLIRGMFGSVGGLVIYMTNPILHNDPSVERPSLSPRDALAALPGTSGFVSKEYENALKSDFYVLRDEVARVANTINDMKNRSPQDIDKYLEKPGVEERMGLQKTVNKITDQLTKIRNNISVISNSADMTAAEKNDAIRELRQVERELLESVDVKGLREMAKI